MAPHILVVDDEPAIGKLLLYQLSGFGYRVTYLQNGLLALQRFMLDRPDLVILDVMMPQISGWEVCRQIRSCSSVPIVMLTAKSADADVVYGLTAGADDYLTKPFSMAQLHARIEAVLRRSSTSPAPASGAPRPEPLPAAPVAPPPAALGEGAAAPVSAPVAQPLPAARSGIQVQSARLANGITLHQAERDCKIRWEFLQAIERENWEYIPRRELRRTLATYGGYLHLDLAPLYGQAQAHLRPYAIARYAIVAMLVVAVMCGLYFL
ncbi:hypothetical protein SE17_30020 [Kouleothrix aurantiaca]|jgi:DNA-binding response OmpR family regulator|uniref:Response regulatory domain-containing protein n=1 Tax=Kouleothrix aurantiaca TaxID=186479 RepID=A0A0P9FBE7_9CHLR|nr:hypothetical protein SE17_30020 [Kouleothrix aurantiaca]